MSNFFASCVDRYLELAKITKDKLKDVETPFLEESGMAGRGVEGNLQPIASKVLMKILYGARMCRYDLLRPTCMLARKVTKWDEACDRKLHRLVSYINCTLDLKLHAWVGDPLAKGNLGHVDRC